MTQGLEFSLPEICFMAVGINEMRSLIKIHAIVILFSVTLCIFGFHLNSQMHSNDD